MADIVLGIGSSHGPLLSTPAEQWDLRAKADRANRNHGFRGKTYDFESLLKERAPGFASEIEPQVRQRRFEQCRDALDQLGRKFESVKPDAVVILGNDQREFFNAGLTPAITVYRGAEIHNVQHMVEGQPGLNIAEPANSPEEGAVYPGATALAEMGAVILPPMPAFYNRPKQIDDLVVHTLARVLDRLGLPHTLAPEWQGTAPRVPPPGA